MNNELYHHGVLGMRWGFRRSKGSQSESSENKLHKQVREMSDEELNARINRMTLEKRYMDAVNSMQPKSKGKVKDLIERIASKSIEDIGTQAGSYALGTLVNEVTGSKVVNPRKIQSKK